MTPCTLWSGTLDEHGYGRDGWGHLAHRIAWEALHGPIPAGLVVRHDCDNPRCVNVDHLRLGTHADNVADRVARGRSAAGERNGRAKLTRDHAATIRQRIDAGESITALAREFGVDRRLVYAIGAGQVWAGPGVPIPNPATCHPDRAPYTRDGRCRPCYLRDWKAARSAA